MVRPEAQQEKERLETERLVKDQDRRPWEGRGESPDRERLRCEEEEQLREQQRRFHEQERLAAVLEKRRLANRSKSLTKSNSSNALPRKITRVRCFSRKRPPTPATRTP